MKKPTNRTLTRRWYRQASIEEQQAYIFWRWLLRLEVDWQDNTSWPLEEKAQMCDQEKSYFSLIRARNKMSPELANWSSKRRRRKEKREAGELERNGRQQFATRAQRYSEKQRERGAGRSDESERGGRQEESGEGCALLSKTNNHNGVDGKGRTAWCKGWWGAIPVKPRNGRCLEIESLSRLYPEK